MKTRFSQGDKVTITGHPELGLFQFESLALMFDDDSKAMLIGVIKAIENQQHEGSPIDEVCVEIDQLEHFEEYHD